MESFFSILPGFAFNFKIGFINIVLSLTLLWLIKIHFTERKVLESPPFWFYLFLLYYLSEIISFILSPYAPPLRRLGGDLWRSMAILTGYWWMNYISRERRKFLFYSMWVTGGFIAIYGIIQTVIMRKGLFGLEIFPSFRTSGFSGNPMTYSGILIILFATSLAFLLSEYKHIRNNSLKFLVLVSVILFLLVSGFNGTRSGEIGIIFSAFAIFVMHFRWKGILITFAAIILFAMVLAFTPIGYRWKVAFNFLKNEKIKMRTSEGTRIILWKFAIQEFENRPITGNGPGTFRKVISREPYAKKLESICHAHNDYLQVLYESGLIGFVFFIIFWFYPFWFFIKKMKQGNFWYRYPIAVIGGLLMAGLFECNLFDAEVVMSVYFLTGMAFKFVEEGE